VSSGATASLLPPRFVRAWALAILTGGAALVLSHVGYRKLPHPRPLEELSYYPSGQLLKPAMLGHPESAADLAWIRAVQYYGEHRKRDNRFYRMAHVFDILTSLAPGFIPAYVFGAFALAQEGRDFRSAERLMLKGIEANPTSGRLAFELGFLYYVRPGGRDLDHAAEYFEQSSRQPDAPPQAARFAAFARQHSGSLAMAYELWSNVYRTSPNPYLRDAARLEMSKIQEALAEGHKDLAVKRLGVPQVLLRPD
jgi:hypothetical protein